MTTPVQDNNKNNNKKDFWGIIRQSVTLIDDEDDVGDLEYMSDFDLDHDDEPVDMVNDDDDNQDQDEASHAAIDPPLTEAPPEVGKPSLDHTDHFNNCGVIYYLNPQKNVYEPDQEYSQTYQIKSNAFVVCSWICK